MIQINDKEYVLKYNIGRINLIENATGSSFMVEIAKNNGMLSIAQLKTYFAYGLKEEGSDFFVPVKKAQEMAQALIESQGYIPVCGMVMEAIERDCPFFFQGV